ncbi:MAG: hypothetical protein OEM05_06845 [Myxococcales bacterium]|nr:hypothetical protein [Myxococcales bacterium]
MTRSEKVALALVAVSTLLYIGLLGIPFLSLDYATKVAVGGAFVAAGEGAFWLGAVIAGPQFVRRCRSKLWPARWFPRSG